jgi:hypothetical protein
MSNKELKIKKKKSPKKPQKTDSLESLELQIKNLKCSLHVVESMYVIAQSKFESSTKNELKIEKKVAKKKSIKRDQLI